MEVEKEFKKVAQQLGLSSENPGICCAQGSWHGSGEVIESRSPIDGSLLGKVTTANPADYERAAAAAQSGFYHWREVPAPQRGQIIREVGEVLRKHKDSLARLITIEMGKILPEALGEIQEAIDVVDFAVGLSRQLYGLSMHSERRNHRMYEQWHPLGIVGCITAFNFPAAVWSWNAFIGAVCGDVILWKPSELTPLTSIAVNRLCDEVAARHGFPGVFNLVCGGREIGTLIAEDKRIPLVSATGSCVMGRSVGEAVARRLGKSLLELGGNNAVIVMPDADFDLAVRSIVFGAIGTAGQRCTSTRRVLAHKSIVQPLTQRLLAAYKQVKLGNPLDSSVLMGPVICRRTGELYLQAIERAVSEGAQVICGGKIEVGMPAPTYLQPAIVKVPKEAAILQDEIFAPILFLIEVESLEQAIEVNNGVPQGLSSAIFTSALKSAESFLSVRGSDCGIANVNLGTSGAEIGGAFGGEKDTGGGRESGSDAWKQYMRRQTSTINYGAELPLAQGIKFEIN